MSDFDKEAEREKLRKKYERDKADREATRRMSDLLLKGATMTNTHCGTCGDPLFRQNGVTFCPTCHGSPDAVEGSGLEGADAEAAGASPDAELADDADPESEAEAETESRTATGEADEPADDAAETGAEGAAETAGTDASRSVDERVARHTTAPRRAPPSQESAGREGRAGGPRHGVRTGRRSSPSAEADVGAPRESLVASLEYFAREAAETDDPRYARDCLEAAREAAETLAVLDR